VFTNRNSDSTHRTFWFCHVVILQFLILPHCNIAISDSATLREWTCDCDSLSIHITIGKCNRTFWFFHVSFRTHYSNRSIAYVASYQSTDRRSTVHSPPDFSGIWNFNFELPELATTEWVLEPVRRTVFRHLELQPWIAGTRHDWTSPDISTDGQIPGIWLWIAGTRWRRSDFRHLELQLWFAGKALPTSLLSGTRYYGIWLIRRITPLRRYRRLTLA